MARGVDCGVRRHEAVVAYRDAADVEYRAVVVDVEVFPRVYVEAVVAVEGRICRGFSPRVC